MLKGGDNMIKKFFKLTIICVIFLCAIFLTFSLNAKKVNLKDFLKGGLILGGVDLFDGKINDFINKITFNKKVPSESATKVVPIISIGDGTHLGAGQVSGPKELVDKTKALIQIEATFEGKDIRVKIFVPSDSKNPLKFNRVQGVGVSALIDVKI